MAGESHLHHMIITILQIIIVSFCVQFFHIGIWTLRLVVELPVGSMYVVNIRSLCAVRVWCLNMYFFQKIHSCTFLDTPNYILKHLPFDPTSTDRQKSCFAPTSIHLKEKYAVWTVSVHNLKIQKSELGSIYFRGKISLT